MPVEHIEQPQINRETLTSVAANIAVTEAFLPRHQDTLQELGLSTLSLCGCDRLVFDTGQDTIIKIARTERKLDINYDEGANWNLYGDCSLFAPVLETGPNNGWLEMAKCKPAEDEDALSRFREKMEQSPVTVIDTHLENIGWLNGELVTYDYPDIWAEEDILH